MKKLEYTLRFATPAFLGNAEQQGQWRTPPFKALIRQWWRVAHAPVVRFDAARLRHDEGLLFGTATDAGGQSSQSSLVRLRLQHWRAGDLGNDKWPRREIRDIEIGKNRVPSDLYLGFGPIVKKKGLSNPVVERRAIAPGSDTNVLSIGVDTRVPETQIDELRVAMSLIGWFGTMGSRSRNGWGSVQLEAGTQGPDLVLCTPRFDGPFARLLRPLADCFALDWPHAIGTDDIGPLVWVGKRDGKPLATWEDAVRFLAELRRDIRGAAKPLGGTGGITANQLIAYPVNNSSNPRWGGDSRLPSSLRFKVLAVPGGLLPLVAHLPCAVPASLMNKLPPAEQKWIAENQLKVWAAAHQAVGQLMRRSGEST